MDVRQALARLAGPPGDPTGTGEAVVAVARAVVERAAGRIRKEIDGVTFAVEEVTWPVAAGDSGGPFPCPHTAYTLLREDAVLLDVRADYFDGSATYGVVGEKLGRWSRFRIGSPGERGFDLHLATEGEMDAFRGEAPRVLEAFGLPA